MSKGQCESIYELYPIQINIRISMVLTNVHYNELLLWK